MKQDTYSNTIIVETQTLCSSIYAPIGTHSITTISLWDLRWVGRGGMRQTRKFDFTSTHVGGHLATEKPDAGSSRGWHTPFAPARVSSSQSEGGWAAIGPVVLGPLQPHRGPGSVRSGVLRSCKPGGTWTLTENADRGGAKAAAVRGGGRYRRVLP